MRGYDVETDVRQNDDGTIASIRVSWHETRPFMEAAGIKLMTLGIGCSMMGWIVVYFGAGSHLLLFGVGSFVIGVLLSFVLPGRPRAVIFHADGRIKTPYGVPYRPWQTEIKGHHEHARSIEARPDADRPSGSERLFEVVVLSRRHALVHLSHNCNEAVALRVAGELTEARDMLREQSSDAVWMASNRRAVA